MYYFTSDIHLRTDAPEVEKRFLRWLDEIAPDAKGIFILGDLFDFWFEWRRVMPKVSVRVLGRLTALADRGVRIVFMTGNHDMWVRDYFATECGFEVYTEPQVVDLEGKRILIAHGDCLTFEGRGIGLRNKLFHSKGLQRGFARLVHPDAAMRFGTWWSNRSRAKHKPPLSMEPFIAYAQKQHVDYAVFGHLHIPGQCDNVTFLGEWSDCPAYATLNEKGELTLCTYI